MSQRIYKPLMAHWITRQQWQDAAITSGVHHTGGRCHSLACKGQNMTLKRQLKIRGILWPYVLTAKTKLQHFIGQLKIVDCHVAYKYGCQYCRFQSFDNARAQSSAKS